MPISVLVADAQPLFAEVLAQALTEYEDLAVRRERPQSAAELAEALGARRPDVAVLDYHLDAVPPDEVATAVSVQLPQTKMVFLSWLHQEVGVRGVLDAGAVGYLPKSCDFDWVAEAVRRAHAGERPVFGDGEHRPPGGRARRRRPHVGGAPVGAQRLGGSVERPRRRRRRDPRVGPAGHRTVR